MKLKSIRTAFLIIVIGIILSIGAALLSNMYMKPTVTEHEFDYSVTYKYNGETKTLQGKYKCYFTGFGSSAPGDRFYSGEFTSHDSPEPFSDAVHIIHEEEDHVLGIVIILSEYYLMGEGDNIDEPYVAIYNRNDEETTDPEVLGQYDIEIISWEYPEPIKNSYKFAGFSNLHSGSMSAMTLVGLAVIVACLIFVKKDKTLPTKAIDILTIVFNFITVLIVMPVMALIVALTGIYTSGEELLYQVDFCTPVITALTVAASISLRRKGFSKTAFLIQFVGPALFAILCIVEIIFL